MTKFCANSVLMAEVVAVVKELCVSSCTLHILQVDFSSTIRLFCQVFCFVDVCKFVMNVLVNEIFS